LVKLSLNKWADLGGMTTIGKRVEENGLDLVDQAGGFGSDSWPVMILNDLTEPILLPLRRVIPSFGGFDFSPVIAIFVLYFIPSIFSWLLLSLF
jgi:hypothetical protein